LLNTFFTVAEAVKSGIAGAGGSATIYQSVDFFNKSWIYTDLKYRIQETLSEDILKIVRAPPRPDYPILLPDDLVNFDAFLFGVPTRYGNFPVQWKVRRQPPLE